MLWVNAQTVVLTPLCISCVVQRNILDFSGEDKMKSLVQVEKEYAGKET